MNSSLPRATFLVYSMTLHWGTIMFKQLLLLVWLLASASTLVFAEETETTDAVESDAVTSSLLDYEMGVIVIETTRESQPVFNVMDIIVSYNDIEIKDTEHLKSLLKEQSSQEKLRLVIIRDKNLLNLEVSPGPWYVALHDMTQEAYATLITDQNGHTLSKHERKTQLGMLQQYLKGRPYRTPNNQGSERDQKPERHSDGKPKDKDK